MGIPIDDLALPPEELPLVCSECEQPIADEAYPDGEKYLCESCFQEIIDGARQEAEEFAEANCKITHKLRRFDPEKKWACSPEEYQSGAIESYTENSVKAHNRHNCTNYDELIPDHHDTSIRAHELYQAIRNRIEELLDDANEDQYEDDASDDNVEGDDASDEQVTP